MWCTSSNKIRILISLEPTQQFSVLGIVDHFLQLSFSTKDNILLIREMDRKTLDSRPFFVYLKLKDIITGLSGGNIPATKIAGNLILLTTSLDGSMTWALVDVLVDVLDSLNGTTNLQINMTIKLNQELSRMCNHMSVVKVVLTFLNSHSNSRVSIIKIAIIFDNGLICKCLWKVLSADIVF